MSKRKSEPSPSASPARPGPETEPKRAARTRAATASAEPPAFTPPYRPSWYDRLARRIDRLPGPSWLAYLLLGVVGMLVLVGVQVLAGAYQPGKYFLLHLFLGSQVAYLLGLMRLLDRSAAAALETFRPVLHLPRRLRTGQADEATSLEELRYRLTTLPPRPTLWASLAGVLLGVVIPLLVFRIPGTTAHSLAAAFVWGRMSTEPGAMAVFLIWMAFSEAVAGVFIYHSIHQLREISRIYLTFTRVNLYRLQPLYAFSVPAALTAGGLILYNYAWFAVGPEFLNQPISIALGVFFATAAAVIFAWPLLGIHRRLVAEKRLALAESARRFEAAAAELHQRVDKKSLIKMDDLNKTLASLELERAALQRIPTWPWDAGTPRGLAVTLVLPLVIWLAQYLLQRLLP
ncbi:MAG: hypothetical protein FJZ97_00675 [Chloroflexi bacterium]|nr:hypothetical protein [Chloroflexota bacterium]